MVVIVYWYYDVVPTFKKIVPPTVVPGLLGGDSAPPDSREKCSQSVPRPSWVLPHRDAWCLLRYLLLSLCLDLWTFRSRRIIYTSVRTFFPPFVLTLINIRSEFPRESRTTVNVNVLFASCCRLLCGAAWGRLYGDFIWTIVPRVVSSVTIDNALNPGKYALIGKPKVNR